MVIHLGPPSGCQPQLWVRVQRVWGTMVLRKSRQKVHIRLSLQPADAAVQLQASERHRTSGSAIEARVSTIQVRGGRLQRPVGC